MGRGLVAGAFGTLLLDVATYVDMALTGRPASNVPGDAVRRTAEAAGVHPPADEARLEAYGALGGVATGLGVGVAASLARSAGVRLPASLGAVAIGGLAMAATNGPMAATGIFDPREWSTADWTRDVIPHLAYGAGVRYAMDRIDRDSPADRESSRQPRRQALSPVGVVARSAALGVATGARSSLSLVGPAVAAGGGAATLTAAGLVTTELVVDKVPGVPDRLGLGPLAARLVGGGAGAVALARTRDGGRALTATAGVVGAAGAFVGSLVGAAWRDVAAERGWTWQGALVEDAVGLGLTVAAWR